MNSKVITVDWDDPEMLSRTLNQLKSRIGELHVSRGSKSAKEKALEIFDACNAIMVTDISHLYKGMTLDPSPTFYVYAHLDTSRINRAGRFGTATFAATLGMDFSPFYIGKGIGDRCNDLNRNDSHRKVRQKLVKFGKDIRVLKVKENLTEQQALELEAKLVDIFGLVSMRGLLVNLDEGVRSAERRLLYASHLRVLHKINHSIP
jgi:hypothetical protein